MQDRVSKLPKQCLTEAEAAEYLGLGRDYLRKGRMRGKVKGRATPPPWIQLGRAVRYLRSDLDQWVLEHRKTPIEMPDFRKVA